MMEMTEKMAAESWRHESDRTTQLAGFLAGFASTDRYPLDEYDRSMIREASGILARSIGRPDLAPDQRPDA